VFGGITHRQQSPIIITGEKIMPRKLEKIFEKEYGKRKGRLIFYKWNAKRFGKNMSKTRLLLRRKK